MMLKGCKRRESKGRCERTAEEYFSGRDRYSQTPTGYSGHGEGRNSLMHLHHHGCEIRRDIRLLPGVMRKRQSTEYVERDR